MGLTLMICLLVGLTALNPGVLADTSGLPKYKFIESIGTVWSRAPGVYPLERLILQDIRVKMPCLLQELSSIPFMAESDWASHKLALQQNLLRLNEALTRHINMQKTNATALQIDTSVSTELLDRATEMLQLAVYNGNEFFTDLRQMTSVNEGLRAILPSNHCGAPYEGINLIHDTQRKDLTNDEVSTEFDSSSNTTSTPIRRFRRQSPEFRRPATHSYHGTNYVFINPSMTDDFRNLQSQMVRQPTAKQHPPTVSKPMASEPTPSPADYISDWRRNMLEDSAKKDSSQRPVPDIPALKKYTSSSTSDPIPYSTNSASSMLSLNDDPQVYSQQRSTQYDNMLPRVTLHKPQSMFRHTREDVCKLDASTTYCLRSLVKDEMPQPISICSFDIPATCKQLQNGRDVRDAIADTISYLQQHPQHIRSKRNAQAGPSVKPMQSDRLVNLQKLRPLKAPSGGIWNIALNSETLEIAARANVNTEEILKNTLEIENTKQNLIRIAHAVQDQFNDTLARLNKTNDLIRRLNKNIENNLDKVERELNSMKAITQWTAQVSNIFKTSVVFLEQFSRGGKDLASLRTSEEALLKAIRDKKLPDTLETNALVLRVITEISQEISAESSIAGHNNLASFFAARADEIGVVGPYVSFRYMIPITQLQDNLVTYKLSSIPFSIQRTWVTYQPGSVYFVINHETNRWIKLTDDEYTQCRSSPYSACSDNFATWKQSEDTCVMNYLLCDKFDVTQCQLQVADVKPNVPALIRQVDDCGFLVSINNQSLEYTKYCSSSFMGNPSVQTDQMSGIRHMVLDAGCKVDTKLFTLSCAPHLSRPVVSTNSVIRLNPAKTPRRAKVSVQKIKHVLLNDKFTSRLEHFSIPSTDNLLSSGGLVNLSALLSTADTSKIRFIDENAAAWHELRSATSKFNIEPINFFSWIPSHTTILTYYSSVLVSGIAYYLWTRARRDMFATTAMAAGATMLPMTAKSYAAPTNSQSISSSIPKGANLVPAHIAETLGDFQDIVDNLTMLVNHWNKTDKNQTFSTQSDDCNLAFFEKPMWIAVFNIAVVTTIHVIVALWMLHHFKKSNLKNNYRNGIIPKNRSTSHHAGEVALCANVLAKFFNYSRSLSCIRAFDVQICTLPRSYDEWFCVKKRHNATWIQSSRFKRFSQAWSMTVAWGEYCIKSHTAPDLETCHELPKVIKVDKDEILYQIKDLDLSLWTSAEATALVKLFLHGRGFYKEIYISGQGTPQPVPSAPNDNHRVSRPEHIMTKPRG